MDIARPDIKAKKNRRRIVTIAVAIVVLAGVTFAVMRLKPAAPTVERSVVWTDTVKRGNLIRQVRGNGTLVPREDSIRQIAAQTNATVTRFLVLPGSNVKADTVIMELSDPDRDPAGDGREARAGIGGSRLEEHPGAVAEHAQYAESDCGDHQCVL